LYPDLASKAAALGHSLDWLSKHVIVSDRFS